MALVQIIMIWGAASAALFPSPSSAGEFEEYQALKAAMVRSVAKRDIPLPPWVSNLDYRRPDSFYWFDVREKPVSNVGKKNDSRSLNPVAVSAE